MKILFSVSTIFIIFNYVCSTEGQITDVATNPQGSVTDSVMQQLFALLREVIQNGNSQKKIPVLDPFVFSNRNIDVSDKWIRINVDIKNGNFTGLGGYEVLQSSFAKDEISIDLHILFPLLKFSAEFYEMNGNIVEAFLIAGKGGIHIEMHNLEIWSKVYLKQSNDSKSILIKSFENPHFKIQQIVSHTDIDSNIDDIVNAMAEELLANYLSRFSKFIAAAYSDTVTQAINPFLNKFYTWRLLAILL